MTAQPQHEPTPVWPKLVGRVALVTGGTRGIGAAICKSLASHGATIAAGYSSNEEKAAVLRSEISAMGVEASIHRGNVASHEDCRKTVQEVLDHHGRIDVLVNNAGITADSPVLKMSDEDWFKVINVNLSGAFFMSQSVLNHMLERGSGRIINISSLIGQMGNIGQANYAASKSGLFGLTMTLAREVARQMVKAGNLDPEAIGITVNTVAPGFIETEMVGSIPEKVLERIRSGIPLGRLGIPRDVARVVDFLAADHSNYITGQVWAVNGGMEMLGH